MIDLCIADREDPITELIAKSILNVIATGEQNPLQVKERAVIRKPPVRLDTPVFIANCETQRTATQAEPGQLG